MRENAEIWTRIEEVFAGIFGDDVPLAPETTAEDVDGWDSVKMVEILIAVEAEFEIRFNTGEMAALENVGQLVQRILDRTSSA